MSTACFSAAAASRASRTNGRRPCMVRSVFTSRYSANAAVNAIMCTIHGVIGRLRFLHYILGRKKLTAPENRLLVRLEVFKCHGCLLIHGLRKRECALRALL